MVHDLPHFPWHYFSFEEFGDGVVLFASAVVLADQISDMMTDLYSLFFFYGDDEFVERRKKMQMAVE